jgi:hypothetical protein
MQNEIGAKGVIFGPEAYARAAKLGCVISWLYVSIKSKYGS